MKTIKTKSVILCVVPATALCLVVCFGYLLIFGFSDFGFSLKHWGRRTPIIRNIRMSPEISANHAKVFGGLTASVLTRLLAFDWCTISIPAGVRIRNCCSKLQYRPYRRLRTTRQVAVWRRVYQRCLPLFTQLSSASCHKNAFSCKTSA